MAGANGEHGYSEEEIHKRLNQYIEGIRYGSIMILIQDGKIVQIEKNEKERFV